MFAHLVGAALAVAVQEDPAQRVSDLLRLQEGQEVRTIEFTSDGSMWLGVRDRGLARVRDDGVRWFGTDDGLMSTGIAALLEDAHGRLWAAGFGGFATFDGDEWRPESRLGDLQPRLVFNVVEDAAGSIWFAANGGAARLRAGEWLTVHPDDGLPHQVVHDVLVDPTGTAWFSCRTGLARLVDGGVETVFGGTNFRSSILAPDGIAWFGSSDGLFGWNGTTWRREFDGIGVFPRLVAEDGTIWAVSDGSGLFVYDGSEWTAVAPPAAAADSEIFDIALDADGRLWLATSDGLATLPAGP